MFNSAKLLSNVASVNWFTTTDVLTIFEGAYPVTFIIRLWQSDRNERYMPDSTAKVVVDFMPFNMMDSGIDILNAELPENVISKPLTKMYPSQDPSIWYVNLTENDIKNIVTGGFRVTVTESNGAKISKCFMEDSIKKTPSSDEVCY